MKVNDVLKEKKRLKSRRRDNRIRKTHNYAEKTKRGVDQFFIDQKRMADVAMEAERKKNKKEIAKAIGLNLKEVF